MTSQEMKRKLSAILSADVKGYSRLMADDEVATVRTINAYRELMTKIIEEHRGRVVDATGDNLLAEFASVVDAVQCAVAVQKELHTQNAELPEHRKMVFRIGINLGDVIHEGDRIYGDGVNVAARIETLADRGGVSISRSAYDQVKNKLALGYEYLGEHNVKNIIEPVRVYRVLMKTEDAGKVIGENRAKKIRPRKAAITALTTLVFVTITVVIWNFYPSDRPVGSHYYTSRESSTGKATAIKDAEKPTPLTILIRMMEPQENWFKENIIKKFEKLHRCNVILKRYGNAYELVEILKKESEVSGKNNVSLVKTPFHLTLLLYKDGLIKPYEDTLSDLKFSISEIDSWLQKIHNDLSPIALKAGTFSAITGDKLYFLPRKLETRLMIYRKSKITDAVNNWHKFKTQINDILKRENQYGLPNNYNLEADVNKWDYYDLLVVGYYWANTTHDGEKTARIAHRSKNYSGTVLGLIDRALQLGATKEDICYTNKFSDAIIDMLYWEAIFRKYNLYCDNMWQEDGWYGYDIDEGIKNGTVYLAWMHQLDCMLIHGSEQLGIEASPAINEDLGISLMPQGVSFELTKDGLPKRTGSKEAHTSGWFWGIPKNAPEPQLALKLVMHTVGYESHLKECKKFYLFPINKRVCDTLAADLKKGWQADVYSTSSEQFKINSDNIIPRFKTLSDYREFLDHYYNAFDQIVIKKGYSIGENESKVDRNIIRQYLEKMEHKPYCG